MFFGKRSLETWLSNSILSSQEICPSFSQPAVGLYIIGHSGGDWNHKCEHSLEATEYALNGDYHANGIELDIRFDNYSLVPKESNVTLFLQVTLIMAQHIVCKRCYYSHLDQHKKKNSHDSY